MTPKQLLFVREYMVDLNATQAAIRAGYSVHTASSQGERLLGNVEVAFAIGETQRKRSERTQVTADMVVREYQKLGFASIADVVTWDRGGVYVRPSAELSPEVLATVAAVKIKRRRDTDAEGRVWDVEEIEVKLHDKQRALDSLAKHLGMFVEKVELTGQIELSVQHRVNLLRSLTIEELRSIAGSRAPQLMPPMGEDE